MSFEKVFAEESFSSALKRMTKEELKDTLSLAVGHLEQILECDQCPFPDRCKNDYQHDECAFILLAGFARQAEEDRLGEPVAYPDE